MKVRTDYDGCEYITPGKVYDIVRYQDDLPVFISEIVEDEIWICLDEGGCAHLGFNAAWEIVEE